jgi:hypothetical protein
MPCLTAAALCGAGTGAAQARPGPISSASGRLVAGTVYRLEEPDLRLPFAPNGAAAGVAARNGTGANADDPNLNFRRHQAVSRAVTAVLDLRARYGDTAALLRLRGWHDWALRDDARSWGNSINGYAAGQPLSDAGAPPLSRFSGVVAGDAWVERRFAAGPWQFLGRVGQQSLDWGAGAGFGGGLEALNPRDIAAARRAGATPAEMKVPVPMLFASATWQQAWSVEGFLQTRFRPNATEVCGSFGAVNDYSSEGCDKVMSGPPNVNDRARVALGAYLKRLPSPTPLGSQFGLGLRWKSAALGLELGAYHARYSSRAAVPSLRRSSRAITAPAVIAGDPDGRNMAFFTEYPDAIRLDALTFSHRSGAWGELSYRPNLPLLFSPGDALPPFIFPAQPALLRADAAAVAPGAVFHGYDRYPMLQAQLGWRQAASGPLGLGWSAEIVGKHVAGLLDPALRRYGRSDVFGTGPIAGTCTPNMTVPALQCSLRGYVSRNALAWRARMEAKLPLPVDALTSTVSVGYVQDVKGWSADALINEGRRSASVGLRFEYRQRYFADIVWSPVWGGDYNALADRDVLALSMGIKF